MSRVLIALIFSAFATLASSQAYTVRSANAVEPVGAIASFLAEKVLEEVYNTATGKPDLVLLAQRLSELEKNHAMTAETQKELEKLLLACKAQAVTRDEFLELSNRIGSEIDNINRRLSEVEERVERLEVETDDLKNGSSNGTSAEYFAARGKEHEKNTNFERAMACYAIALKIDANCKSAYRGRCNIHRSRKAWQALLDDADRGVNAWFNDTGDEFKLDRVIARSELWRLSTIVGSLTPAPPRSQEEYEQFLSDCDWAIDNSTDLNFVYRVRGLSKLPFVAGNTNWADYTALDASFHYQKLNSLLDDLDQAIELDPNDAVARVGRAMAYSQIRDSYWRMREHQTSLEEQFGDQRRILQHDDEQLRLMAIADLNEALRIDPASRDSYLLLKSQQRQSGVDYRSPEGVALIERELAIVNRAVTELPNDPDIRRARADVFALQALFIGKTSAWDDMLAESLRIVELVPDQNYGYEQVATVYAIKGEQTKSQHYDDLAREKRRLRGRE